MMKFKINNMNNLILILFMGSIILFSCKRDKEVMGPEIGIASSNFNVDFFKFNFDTSDFQTAPASNWFNAPFNERVSWQIKISGTKSKAYKIISGISDGLNQANSSWYGTHTNPYFFIEGDTVVAELSVLGSDQTWKDSSYIKKEIKDYGPDVLIWWNMEQTSSSNFQGVPSISLGTWWNGACQGVKRIEDPVAVLIDPVQGPYRSMEAIDAVPSMGWVGGTYQNGEASPPRGFPGASLDDVYLNFYVRKRTSDTKSMAISMNSKIPKVLNGRTVYLYSKLSYTYTFPAGSASEDLIPHGFVGVDGGDGMGWNLVSVRLSNMTPEGGKPTFDPSKIVSMTLDLKAYPVTGFDIDFIVLTKGAPFNQIK